VVLLCAGLRGSAAELVIDVFSGLPNPTLTLAESAVTHVQSKLDEASPAPAQDPVTVFPARLGYRSVVILHWPASQTTDSVLRIRGQDILETRGTEQHWFRAPDVSLEPYLVDLAHQKGAINAELYDQIRLDIAGRFGQPEPPEPFRVMYAFDVWAGRTKCPLRAARDQLGAGLAALGVTSFLRRDDGVWSNGRKSSDYIFEPADAPGMQVRLRIWEGPDITDAHRAMLNDFANSAAPQPFPLGSTLGMDIGDRCYPGWGAVGDSINFVRNNVFASLAAPGHPVLGLAGKLDGELAVRSFTGPVLLQAGISERAFHVSVPTAPGKTYVIESNDALGDTNWTRFPPFAGDGTIRRVAVPAGSTRQFFRLRVE
jgi:hypothetical protein